MTPLPPSLSATAHLHCGKLSTRPSNAGTATTKATPTDTHTKHTHTHTHTHTYAHPHTHTSGSQPIIPSSPGCLWCQWPGRLLWERSGCACCVGWLWSVELCFSVY